MPRIEVCFSPALYPLVTSCDYALAVIDVLRATTAICAAFDRGASGIIPVANFEEAVLLKKQGYLLVAERDGLKPEIADLGNSPLGFNEGKVKDRILVFTTTNGTQAIDAAKNSVSLVIASFSNISRVVKYFKEAKQDVLLLCSGWKNQFSLEDTLCAGAIAQCLSQHGRFTIESDSALAAVNLWNMAKDNLAQEVFASDHGRRLLALGLEDDIRFCLNMDTSPSLPVWNREMLVDQLKTNQ